MAKKPRGKRRKRVAKSKKVPPVTAYSSGEAGLPLNPRLRSLAPSASEMSSGLTEPILPEEQNIAAAGAFAGGAFQTDAFQVGGAEAAVTADTTAVTADTASATVVSAVGTARVSRNALSERPVEIRDAARALSQEFKDQVEELKALRLNDPDRLDQRDDLLAFFEKMAAGLNNLADALDRAVNEAADGKPEPALLGKAAEVVQQLQQGVMEWLAKNRTTLIEVPVRIGLFGLGLAFVHALGVDGHLVTTLIAGLALKQAPKRRR
jgi:hypothetical protein